MVQPFGIHILIKRHQFRFSITNTIARGNIGASDHSSMISTGIDRPNKGYLSDLHQRVITFIFGNIQAVVGKLQAINKAELFTFKPLIESFTNK
ncbi:hypothetical protein ALON55S_03198 [Alishewanella longhuensis]